jgi:hypothetical protein
MKALALFMTVIGLCSAAFADNHRQQILADKLVDEYAACAAYYEIVAVDLEKLGKQASAANAYQASEAAQQQSQLAARQGRSDELARQLARSRLEFYIKGITRHTDRKMSNIAVLAGKPGQRCKHAIENPDAFRNELDSEIPKGIDQ